MSNRFTFTINDAEGFAVSIFDAECPTGTDAPNIYQPVNVNKADEPFESHQEAEEFATKFIEQLTNPKSYVSSVLAPPSVEETPAE
jgi:hypothetical protein